MNTGISKLWSGEIIGRVLSVTAAFYSARVIGVESYGLAGYVAAIVAYCTVLVRFGLDAILIREISKNSSSLPFRKDHLRSVIVLIRMSIGFIAIGILIILGYLETSNQISYLFFANIVGIIGLFFPLDSLLQAEMQFGRLALSRVLFNLFNLICIVFFVQGPGTVWWIPLASGISLLGSQSIFFRSVKGAFSIPSKEQLFQISIHLFRESIPILSAMLLLLFIGQLGIIMVKYFADPQELGLYVFGYKIYDITIAMIVPVSVTLFPELSRNWGSVWPTDRTDIILRGVMITLPIALFATGVSYLCGEETLKTLLGRPYGGANTYLILLMITLIFRSISMFFANALVACGRQRDYLKVTALVVAFNIIIGYLLISRFGAYGAAWTNIIAFICELFGFFAIIRPSIDHRALIIPIIKVMIIFLLSLATGWYFKYLLKDSLYSSFGSGAVYAMVFILAINYYKGRSNTI